MGDFIALNFASDTRLPSLKKGRVAAHCAWVSPLSLGSAPSLCRLSASWGCGHRAASVSLPAQPGLAGKKLIFVSSWVCGKYLLVCSNDGYFLPFFYFSALIFSPRHFAGWRALEQRSPRWTGASFVAQGSGQFGEAHGKQNSHEVIHNNKTPASNSLKYLGSFWVWCILSFRMMVRLTLSLFEAVCLPPLNTVD